jgi:hypothetical protein
LTTTLASATGADSSMISRAATSCGILPSWIVRISL